MNVKHSSKFDSWMTPISIVGRIYQVLDTIDLDPCSSEAANIHIGAKTIFTEETNGLTSVWPEDSTIFLNPPGGRKLPLAFWRKLMMQRSGERFRDAIFLCFSIEQLQTFQKPEILSPLHFPFCIPKRRIPFDPPEYVKRSSPPHGNVLVYVPCTEDRTDQFCAVFSDVGRCVIPKDTR